MTNDDYIDEINNAVCGNIIVNDECRDFEIDDYDDVRERSKRY